MQCEHTMPGGLKAIAVTPFGHKLEQGWGFWWRQMVEPESYASCCPQCAGGMASVNSHGPISLAAHEKAWH